jgi:putative ABC transport system substrate-binding protein
LPELVTEIIRSAPDVIVVAGSIEWARALSDGNCTVPTVIVNLNPVAAGLVPEFARPGGCFTGVSNMGAELAGKRVEMLKQVMPGLTQLAGLWQVPGSTATLAETQAAAHTLGISMRVLEVNETADLAQAFDSASNAGADALLLLPSTYWTVQARQIADLAVKHRLPTMSTDRSSVDVGVLMSYGPDGPTLYRMAAGQVDKILKGTKPAEIPIEQPTKFEFVINLKTAQVLGLTIPRHVLDQATELIQ